MINTKIQVEVMSWQWAGGHHRRITQGFCIASVLIIKLAEATGIFIFSCFITCLYVTLFYMYQGFPNLQMKVIIGSIYILFARPLLAVLIKWQLSFSHQCVNIGCFFSLQYLLLPHQLIYNGNVPFGTGSSLTSNIHDLPRFNFFHLWH